MEEYLAPFRDPSQDRRGLKPQPQPRWCEMKGSCPQRSRLFRLPPLQLKTLGFSRWSQLGLSRPGTRLTPLWTVLRAADYPSTPSTMGQPLRLLLAILAKLRVWCALPLTLMHEHTLQLLEALTKIFPLGEGDVRVTLLLSGLACTAYPMQDASYKQPGNLRIMRRESAVRTACRTDGPVMDVLRKAPILASSRRSSILLIQ